MRRIVVTTVAAVALLLVGPAAMAGSDSPTPYTVDTYGITLPAGHVFRDNGHVNIRSTDGATGLHFEAKCVTRTDAECAGPRHTAAQYIGASFIPWSAFGLTDACVTWVQLSDFNEHFGEGGQEPVCLGTEEPCPSPTPTASPSTPSSPSPTPTTSGPSPTGSPSSTPSPTISPTSVPTVEPTRPPTSRPSPTQSSSSPTPSLAPTSPAPEPTPTVAAVPSPVVGELAATGVDTGLVLMTGVYLLLGGLIAWGLHYKNRHEGGAR